MNAPEDPGLHRSGGWTQAIPTGLQPAFEDYVRKHCRSFLLAINLIAAFAYFSYVIADALVVPDIAMTSLWVRAVLIVIGLCNIFLVFRYSRSVLLMDQLMPIHDIISTLAWFELLKHSQSPDVPTYLYASMIFIVLCNLGVRVSFKGALACSLAISAVILGNVWVLHPGDPKGVMVFALVYLPVLCFSLFISWTNTLSVRRAFLADVAVRCQQTELFELNQRLQELASTDGLTRVGNRRAFDAQLLSNWSRTQQNGRAFALLLADIDFFKAYNDHYGHQAGDMCLKQVAYSMVHTLRHGQGKAFRYGGEEFAVLLQVSTLEELNRIVERLIGQVAALNIEHRHRPDGLDHVTISVGASLSRSADVRSAQDLLACCDRLLYQAKQQGRNQVCLAPD